MILLGIRTLDFLTQKILKLSLFCLELWELWQRGALHGYKHILHVLAMTTPHMCPTYSREILDQLTNTPVQKMSPYLAYKPYIVHPHQPIRTATNTRIHQKRKECQSRRSPLVPRDSHSGKNWNGKGSLYLSHYTKSLYPPEARSPIDLAGVYTQESLASQRPKTLHKPEEKNIS